MVVGKLHVTVYECTRLKDWGIFGPKLVPYVRLRVGNMMQRTTTCKTSRKNPKWDQTFTFNVNDTVQARLNVEAMSALSSKENKDNKDKMVGHISFLFAKMAIEKREANGIYSIFRKGNVAGQIRLKLSFELDPNYVVPEGEVPKEDEDEIDIASTWSMSNDQQHLWDGAKSGNLDSLAIPSAVGKQRPMNIPVWEAGVDIDANELDEANPEEEVEEGEGQDNAGDGENDEAVEEEEVEGSPDQAEAEPEEQEEGVEEQEEEEGHEVKEATDVVAAAAAVAVIAVADDQQEETAEEVGEAVHEADSEEVAAAAGEEEPLHEGPFWEYKWTEDAVEIHGPFSAPDMASWAQQGYFKGDQVAFVRQVPNPYLESPTPITYPDYVLSEDLDFETFC
mmetsp:Transcript_20560/g.35335  ORF Transcript_20560/g.35335 Transcript_20560/m.35335 type:complete len:393 (+) Transcript_20560:147-1325(+)|eukprot:CAMPEP_0196658828 /NCGR_PEP_ID=MMETSP1086-20130531/31822_1 /TAXON_ID=77921 /ORGANISM="Cyanoptyche  gloeocystis , Strain SAG4.97" /LENGTH=392 /DNA_ID=CAMNT_0041992577 /DNA_START=132 /DNA_END=1310 /DNA_ORIENTATION=-